ncbi:hypothetical protein CspHIS471_0404120 [Cutaneotrichosporon sp. HIS471]|nr:hypothetical protein CspHIS471_0404120 [Cutaneotrichosporon sp. HIS471]
MRSLLPTGNDSEPNHNDSAPKITDDPTWTNGDFEVITSDQVRFRVNTHLLLGASKVLASAAAASTGGKKIEFLGDTETAQVFRAFLNLVSTGQTEEHEDVSEGSPQDFCVDTANLALFLQKWDCPAHLSHLITHLHLGVLLDDLSAMDFFFVAAAIKDSEAATAALKSTTRKWVGRDGVCGYISGRSCFDPRGWSLSRYREWETYGNVEYLWALSRAYGETSADLSKLSKKFAEYLALTEGK